uniref:Uncharacterized protein n=1 Tax=Arundo donax TaxID=35708 RepID=A0A0A9FNW8_ARUDO
MEKKKIQDKWSQIPYVATRQSNHTYQDVDISDKMTAMTIRTRAKITEKCFIP